MRPARAPRVIGLYGGRHTVVPVSAMVRPVASAMIATALTVSSLPWAGPIVTVVYRQLRARRRWRSRLGLFLLDRAQPPCGTRGPPGGFLARGARVGC